MRMFRLRFWLGVTELFQTLRVPLSWYLWSVGKASDATDWGPGAKLGDEEPF